MRREVTSDWRCSIWCAEEADGEEGVPVVVVAAAPAALAVVVVVAAVLMDAASPLVSVVVGWTALRMMSSTTAASEGLPWEGERDGQVTRYFTLDQIEISRGWDGCANRLVGDFPLRAMVMVLLSTRLSRYCSSGMQHAEGGKKRMGRGRERDRERREREREGRWMRERRKEESVGDPICMGTENKERRTEISNSMAITSILLPPLIRCGRGRPVDRVRAGIQAYSCSFRYSKSAPQYYLESIYGG